MAASALSTLRRNSAPSPWRWRSYQEMHRPCPPQLPDGRVVALGLATADAPLNLLPRNANRALPIKLIEPTVKFFSLRLRQRHCSRAQGKAVPQLFQQLEPLFGAKGLYIDRHRLKV